MMLGVNGVNLMPYIAQKGIKWQRIDKEGRNAGETMDGVTHRERLGSKVRLDITCLPLSSEDAAVVLNAISPEYVTVEYTDPMYGHAVKTMYCKNVPATYIDMETNRWEGIVFSLSER